jgi:tetratricopeptide (TPR) repeat protein
MTSINLGVLYFKVGRYDEARGCYDDALRVYTALRNESNRVATLINLAHLARERGQFAEAVSVYDTTAAAARAIGKSDIEAGAIAGAGLAELSLGSVAAAGVRLDGAEKLIASQPDWWFQGRELVKALRVRHAARTGSAARARQVFTDAVTIAERHNVYAAAWVVAESAGDLAHDDQVHELLQRYQPEIERLGYVALSRRLSALAASRVIV